METAPVTRFRVALPLSSAIDTTIVSERSLTIGQGSRSSIFSDRLSRSILNETDDFSSLGFACLPSCMSTTVPAQDKRRPSESALREETNELAIIKAKTIDADAVNFRDKQLQ